MTNKVQYQYVDPIKNGYKKFKLTRKQHNELFPKKQIKNRSIDWKSKYEYYYNDDRIIMERLATLPAKIFVTILYPFYLKI